MFQKKCVIISGCSGGGKSTLIDHLSKDGWITVPEAGRQVVQQELMKNRHYHIQNDIMSFVRKAVHLGLAQTKKLISSDFLISDRSTIDVITYLKYCERDVPKDLEKVLAGFKYINTVFMTPPWSDIYIQDKERNKPFKEAILEYNHLYNSYIEMGYHIIEIPKLPIPKRIDFMNNKLKKLKESFL